MLTQQIKCGSEDKDALIQRVEDLGTELQTLQYEAAEQQRTHRAQVQELLNVEDRLKDENNKIKINSEQSRVGFEELFEELKQVQQEEIEKTSHNYEQTINELRQVHQKDKEFIEELYQQADGKLRKYISENKDFISMENKYLKDIKELNDSFDDYKK